MKKLDDVGGLEYVLNLPNLVGSAANIEYYANIVAEKALARNLISTCTELTTEAYDGQKETEALLDDAERRILQLSDTKNRGDFASVGAVVEVTLDKITKLYENKAGLTGLPTGFRDLDRMTSGLQPSDLILVAARPSMGKTAFTLNIAQNVGVRQHKTVAFFSLEMSQEQLVQRLLCQIAHIDSQKLRTGQLNSDEEWTRLTDACDKLYESPIYIDDTPGISVAEMRSKARRLKSEHGLDLIIVDYLQLMQGRNAESRQQEISEISRSLKALARELKVRSSPCPSSAAVSKAGRINGLCSVTSANRGPWNRMRISFPSCTAKITTIRKRRTSTLQKSSWPNTATALSGRSSSTSRTSSRCSSTWTRSMKVDKINLKKV